MKIAIIVRILWSAGTQKFAIMQARALVKAGHDVELIFLRRTSKGGVYDELLKDLKYKILTDYNASKFVPIYDFLTRIFMSNREGDGRVDYNLIKRLPTFVKGGNYELLICQDQWAGLGGYYCWKKIGLKYVVVIHERINNFPWVTGIRRFLVRLALQYQKKVLANASKVFSLTKKVASTAEDFYSKYNLKVVDNFPGLEIRGVKTYSEKTDTIVLVSFWNEVKFPELYIDLFRKLEGYRFLMIGNWISESYKKSFFQKLQDLKLLGKVRIIENQSEAQKNELISSSKYYVRFGSGEYGPGYGSIEAIELGVPLIINKELGISDYLSGYNCACVVDGTDNVAGIIDYIKGHDNPESYLELQGELKRFAVDHSWENHCRKLMECMF